MTVLALPAIDGVQSMDFDIERNVAVAQNPLGATVQRQVRSGDRWRGTLNFPPNQDDDAGVLVAFLKQATRGDRWFYLSPPQNSVRGNWNPAELVTNGTLLTGLTTGWTASGSTLSVNTRRLKVKNTGAASGDARQNIVLEANKPHALIFDTARGIATAARAQIKRQTDNVSEADTGALIAPTRGVLLVTPTVAAMYLQLMVNTAVAADDLFYSGIMLTRCLQVNGAGQVGNRLNVDGGPANTAAALKAGEFVCFPAGAADNAPVIVRRPFARFMIPDHKAPDAISAPNFHGFAIEVVEDITPGGSLYQLVQLTEDFDTDSSGAGTLVFEPGLRV